MVDQDRIIKINIEEEMKSAYIDYSMSVIVSRALPDVRDGFKPVHRRILFGMNTIHMVTRLFISQWFVWHRHGLCAIRWWMDKETLARWTVTVLLPCVIQKQD